MHLWISSGGTEHFLSNIKDMHKGSWFSFEGLSRVLVPKLGALAGTSFADLLFTMADAKVLKTARGLIKQGGVNHKLDVDKFVETFGFAMTNQEKTILVDLLKASFVDDGVWPVFAKATELVEKVRTCIGILDKVCVSFGLRVNYKKGKTMAMLKFYGKASVAARTNFTAQGSEIKFQGWLGPNNSVGKKLLSTDVYKHMGSLTDVHGSQLPEICARVRAMKGAYRKIRCKVTRNTKIPVKKQTIGHRHLPDHQRVFSSIYVGSLDYC